MIDNQEPTIVTWNEFLRFLDREGTKRMKMNDGHLYGRSVKRFHEFHRHSLRETKTQRESFIEHCLYFQHGSSLKFMLCLFDKKAKVLEAQPGESGRWFECIQELRYLNEYTAVPEAKSVAGSTVGRATTKRENSMGPASAGQSFDKSFQQGATPMSSNSRLTSRHQKLRVRSGNKSQQQLPKATPLSQERQIIDVEVDLSQ